MTEEELRQMAVAYDPRIRRLVAEVRRLREENSLYLKTIDALNGMVEQEKKNLQELADKCQCVPF